MNKIKKNGFTLVEMMVATGLVGIITIATYSSLKTSKQASNITVIGAEVSTLKSLIAAQLANPVACSKTFPYNTAVTRTNVNILNTVGGIVARRDQNFGEHNEFKITNISTSSAAITSNILKIKVDYEIRANVSKAGKRNNSFELDIFVNKNSTGNLIAGCFADIAGSTRKAIKDSCIGPGAIYSETDGTYGSCTHHLPEVRSASGAVIAPTPTSICPVGQYLKQVDTPENSPATANKKTIFQCVTLAIGPCPAYSYIKNINPSTGAADCVKLSDLYASGKVLGARSGKVPTYVAVSIICPDKEVLRAINADGSPNCMPQQIDGTKVDQMCGVNEVIWDVTMSNSDNTYKINCKKFTNVENGCGTDLYLQKINPDGTIPTGGCAPLTIPARCTGASQVMIGLDSNGNALCGNSY